MAVVGDQDVAGLDVAVDDAMLVGVAEGGGHVGADVGGALGRQRASRLEDGRQGSSIDELHDNEVGAGVLTPVEHRDNVVMREIGGSLSLAAEPLHERAVDGQFRKEDLQCHRTVQ